MKFEQRVQLEHTSYIDVMIPATHTMIEQKGLHKNLNEPIRQSDGTMLKPAEQAKRYAAALPYSERPRWIISCNFREFQVFDMERPNDDPERIELANLETDYYRLNFMVDVKDSHIQREMEISKGAGDIVAKVYQSLIEQYRAQMEVTDEVLQQLNKLCVRLVFCLYAEDAGLFGKRNMFHDYLMDFRPQHFRKALLDLFRVLDQKPEERDPFEEESLLAFPYVNGSLFSESVIIPQFQQETVDLILNDACNFDWSQISPTIFGAIFESTLNPETRRKGGMHYTSIENIHKVIDPLFLDAYKEKFQSAMTEKVLRKRTEKLKALQDELAAGRYFDPAAGSGNFLTESYLSLRRLENDILRETITDDAGTGMLGFVEEELNPIKVSINQFYGIEINDFAVSVAKTAMWIAEAQMFRETEGIINREMDFLPLHTYLNIHEGNALRMDWKTILIPSNNVKIFGNPPFSGVKVQTNEHKEDMKIIGQGKIDKIGLLDYVCGWYLKATEYIEGTSITVAFVSTNSISQGEQPQILWNELLKNSIEINFAYKTFVWRSESNQAAKVHCIIIGFSKKSVKRKKYIYNNNIPELVENITPYLTGGTTILVKKEINQFVKSLQ